MAMRKWQQTIARRKVKRKSYLIITAIWREREEKKKNTVLKQKERAARHARFCVCGFEWAKKSNRIGIFAINVYI